MISIPGDNLTEVMQHVAADSRFSDDEKSAAADIAAELSRHECQEAENRKAEVDSAERGVRYYAPNPAPPNLNRSRIADDWFTIASRRFPRVVFSVRPYTTGRTMNVGVSNEIKGT